MSRTLEHLGLGVIEGFFGRPWSWDARRDYAAFLSRKNYRYYIYAPKADPVLRQDWQGHWSVEHLEALRELRALYSGAGIAWGIGLNLYELHCAYDDEAVRDLEGKIRYLNDLRPDILAVLFDDMRGDVSELARIQCDITHRVAELTSAGSVIMCPTYYTDSPVLDRLFGQRPENYLETLGKRLDPAVNIFWTGPEICSDAYPVEHVRSVRERLGRKPTIWDNYPVNDSARMCRFLHLRAFENRPHQLPEWTAGHAVNPMNQAYLSQIPLMTLDSSYREKERYSADEALRKAARELCGRELGDCLLEDLELFQDRGLDGMGPDLKAQLIARYGRFAIPHGREIVAWLNGEYPYSPECLTE